MLWNDTASFLQYLCRNTHISQPNHKKTSDSNGEAFYTITDQYLSKALRAGKQKKNKKLSQFRGQQRHRKTTGNKGFWTGSWNKQRILGKKTVKFE